MFVANQSKTMSTLTSSCLTLAFLGHPNFIVLTFEPHEHHRKTCLWSSPSCDNVEHPMNLFSTTQAINVSLQTASVHRRVDHIGRTWLILW